MNKRTPHIVAIALFLFLASTGLSYSIFGSLNGPSKTGVPSSDVGKKKNDFDAIVFGEGEKTESCPLNGAMYTKEQKDWWSKHRPLGVMVENHEEARPQSGLSFADVIYESVAEGGITRFLTVFYCQDAGIVGPIRSARTYFLDYISEYGESPLYTHVGGANTPGPANALGQIEDYGWAQYNDINQFSVGFPTFRRDESRLGREVATEHTMYSATSKLWAVGESRGLTGVDKDDVKWDEEFVPYTFKDGAPASERPTSQTVSISFWDYDAYAVVWKYDKASNTYKRTNGGTPHMDRNTNKQLSAKNVIVLFMSEGRANDGYEGNLHMLYGTKGSGKALVFTNGEEIKANWKKSGRTGRTILTDSTGQEIEFTRGNMWFEIQPLDGVVGVK